MLLVDGSKLLVPRFPLCLICATRKANQGALYGVVNMLRKLVSDHKAEYAACIFDARGKTFRDDLYPDYKSHRPPMPEDLAAQIEPIHRAVRC